jgi:chromosome segregation ATPase
MGERGYSDDHDFPTGDGSKPADIKQAEWDRIRGYVIRTGAIVESLVKNFKVTNANLESTRIECRELRVALANFQKGVVDRLDKHSDWRETTGKHDIAKLEKQLEQKEREIDDAKKEEKRRVAGWVKVVIGVAAAIAEAGIVHYLHW